MVKPNDLSRSRVALEEDSTLIAVIEMSLGSWLVAGRIPGVDRNPLRKQDPDPDTLLIRLHQWRDEAVRAGHPIIRIALPSPLKPGATASGWHAGYWREASKPMSSTRPAYR